MALLIQRPQIELKESNDKGIWGDHYHELVVFLIARTKYLTRNNLKQEKFILAHSSGEYGPSQRGRHGGQSSSENMLTSGEIRKQKEKQAVLSKLSSFLYSTQSTGMQLLA